MRKAIITITFPTFGASGKVILIATFAYNNILSIYINGIIIESPIVAFIATDIIVMETIITIRCIFYHCDIRIVEIFPTFATLSIVFLQAIIADRVTINFDHFDKRLLFAIIASIDFFFYCGIHFFNLLIIGWMD
jgi:hypothetical protein